MVIVSIFTKLFNGEGDEFFVARYEVESIVNLGRIKLYYLTEFSI